MDLHPDIEIELIFDDKELDLSTREADVAIRMSAFVFLAVILGSVVWNLGASWGWHPDGWLVRGFGFHDTAAAGVVHTIAGWFAFGLSNKALAIL